MFKQHNVFFKRTDVFVASYPRSGSTWLRLMLTDAILQRYGFPTDIMLPIHPDRIIPDMYRDDVNDVDPRIKLPYRFIMTHQPYNEIRGRVIYIFRNPADSLCSYYHFHLRYQHLRDKVNGIDAFCREHLSEWCQHLENYVQAKQKKKENFFFVSYEKMHERPVGIVKAVLKFYGFDLEENVFSRAVEHHTFEKQRANEKLEGRFEYFFRKGKVNGAREELNAETIAFIEQHARGIYNRAREMEKDDYYHGSEYFRSPQELQRQILYTNMLDNIDFVVYNRHELFRIQTLRRLGSKLLMKLWARTE